MEMFQKQRLSSLDFEAFAAHATTASEICGLKPRYFTGDVSIFQLGI